MTHCEHCGVAIGYLPFKCKYCGGVFCKKHRLPENHECTFELKHIPITPTSIPRGTASTPTKPISQEYLYNGPKELKKYLKRQEKERKRTLRSYSTSYSGTSRYKGTKTLIWVILIASIVALIFEYNSIPEYIYLSLNGLVFKFTFHTFITALFVAESSIIWIFFLFIMLIFLYMIARNIEVTHGTTFLIKLYFICTLFSALFYILLRVALVGIYPLINQFNFDYVGLAWGGILGLMAFSLYPVMNQQITTLMYFIPIRMRGRTFLLFLILIRLIPGLFFSLFEPLYLWVYLPDLGGILGSYLVYKSKYGMR